MTSLLLYLPTNVQYCVSVILFISYINAYRSLSTSLDYEAA